jgi:hypothetical protein
MVSIVVAIPLGPPGILDDIVVSVPFSPVDCELMMLQFFFNPQMSLVIYL